MGGPNSGIAQDEDSHEEHEEVKAGNVIGPPARRLRCDKPELETAPVETSTAHHFEAL